MDNLVLISHLKCPKKDLDCALRAMFKNYGIVLNGDTTTPTNVQTFAADGVYTPTPGMKSVIVEILGAGGGSGGIPAAATNTESASGSGGGGGYAKVLLTAAQVGASQAITIGTGGLAGAAGANPGGQGGLSSFGALATATGGLGGAAGSNDATLVNKQGAIGGGYTITTGVDGGSQLGYSGENATAMIIGTTFMWQNGKGGGNALYGAGQNGAFAFSGLATGPAALGSNGGSQPANTGLGGNSNMCQNAGPFSGMNGGSGYVRITELFV